MSSKVRFSLCVAMASLLAVLCSCTSTTTFDTNVRVHYTDEKELKKDPDIKVPTYTKESYGDYKLGVLIYVDNRADFGKSYTMNFDGRRAVAEANEDIAATARLFVLGYLARLKRYAIYIADPLKDAAAFRLASDAGTPGTDLYIQADLDYYMKLEISVLKEIFEGYHVDRDVYKVSLAYKLFDAKTNRIITSGTAKNLTTRKGASYSYSGGKIGGSNMNNVQNIYRNLLENCMIELRCQLANKLPIAGNIVEGSCGGNFTLLLDKGAEQGVVSGQQFAVFAKPDEKTTIPLGYAVASGTGEPDTCNLVLWRQAKSPEAKRIFKGWKKDIQGWIGDNEIHAVSIGMPRPPATERTNIQDWDTTKFEQQLLREWK